MDLATPAWEMQSNAAASASSSAGSRRGSGRQPPAGHCCSWLGIPRSSHHTKICSSWALGSLGGFLQLHMALSKQQSVQPVLAGAQPLPDRSLGQLPVTSSAGSPVSEPIQMNVLSKGDEQPM